MAVKWYQNGQFYTNGKLGANPFFDLDRAEKEVRQLDISVKAISDNLANAVVATLKAAQDQGIRMRYKGQVIRLVDGNKGGV